LYPQANGRFGKCDRKGGNGPQMSGFHITDSDKGRKNGEQSLPSRIGGKMGTVTAILATGGGGRLRGSWFKASVGKKVSEAPSQPIAGHSGVCLSSQL
jgi:hypothetical protein